MDKHQDEILSWLREHPNLTSVQIADWLDERYPACEVGESTGQRYVSEIRKEFNIPKTTQKRTYDVVPELPMGFQAQLGFDQTWLKNEQGRCC